MKSIPPSTHLAFSFHVLDDGVLIMLHQSAGASGMYSWAVKVLPAGDGFWKVLFSRESFHRIFIESLCSDIGTNGCGDVVSNLTVNFL